MMTSQQRYLLISAVVFATVAIAHVLRALKGWPITIGPLSVPIEVSWLGAIATAALSLWAILLLRDHDD